MSYKDSNMKGTPASHIGFYRSPSPVCNKNIIILENLEKPSKAIMRVLVNNSNSYKKLKKVCINDTSLVFIHKVKEKGINSTVRRLLNPNLSINPINTSSIQVILKAPAIEYSQRGSPYLINTKSPDGFMLPKAHCETFYAPNKNRYVRDIYKNELSSSLRSNSGTERKTGSSNVKFIGKSCPEDYGKNPGTCLTIRGFNRKKAGLRLKRVNEIQNIFKDSMETSKYSTGVQADDCDITAWRS